ncbi:unnamed protein product, partial [marine sediment metagenome]
MGGVDLYFYRLSTGKYEKKNLLYFDKILDFSYSHDGSQFVFSAVKEGLNDIFIHNIVSGTNEQITRDIADDFNPRFIQGSDAIIFSSNRINDTLMFSRKTLQETSLNFDLFIYDFKNRSKMLTRLSEWKYVDKHNPFQIKDYTYTYLNNLNGIQNRYLAEFDSTISYVDTVTHYRYFTKSYPLTNYS